MTDPVSALLAEAVPLPFGRPLTFDDLKLWAAPLHRLCRGAGFVVRTRSGAPAGADRNRPCPCGSGLKAKRCACADRPVATQHRCRCTELGLRDAGLTIAIRGREAFLERVLSTALPTATIAGKTMQVVPANDTGTLLGGAP